ncbi:MAG: VWA domain-containing protein [Verrucomicrobia bacterium]|nr:VWA domain-containing protein [Verrucomicrobiota bacterium]
MDFTHPHFAEPDWLWLALLVPAGVAALFAYARRARRHQAARFAAAERLGDLTPSHSPHRRTVKHALLLLSAAAMSLALARPQWGEQAELSRALGEDILFLLDTSRSMLATDVRPDRLSRAKLAILDFVQRHGRGRVGLVAFSGQAFLQCPLTFDYDAFQEALRAVDDKTIPVLGTDIGRALDEAFRATEKNDRRKIMVLITDGEDLEKTGPKTAETLADRGVVVFTVGVGTPAGSLVHYTTPQGIPAPLRDSQGQLVVSRLDESTLRRIAESTHGRYLPLGALGEGMSRIRHLVETSTDLPGSAQVRKWGVDRFHVPVAAAAVMLVAESLIGTRRRLRDTGQN